MIWGGEASWSPRCNGDLEWLGSGHCGKAGEVVRGLSTLDGITA